MQKEKSEAENSLITKTNEEMQDLEHKYKIIKKKLKREKEVSDEQASQIKELLEKQQTFNTQINNEKIIEDLNQKILTFESQISRQEQTIKDQSHEISNLQADKE